MQKRREDPVLRERLRAPENWPAAMCEQWGGDHAARPIARGTARTSNGRATGAGAICGTRPRTRHSRSRGSAQAASISRARCSRGASTPLARPAAAPSSRSCVPELGALHRLRSHRVFVPSRAVRGQRPWALADGRQSQSGVSAADRVRKRRGQTRSAGAAALALPGTRRGRRARPRGDPWRVAVVASASWGHLFLVEKHRPLYQVIFPRAHGG
jgi:hypothetical protein